MCARGCCERRALRAGVLVAPWTVEKGSAGWRARMLSAGVALAQTYHVVQEPLRPTGEYLGHEAAEAARAGQLWEKIALYESAHPVSLKARAPIAPNPNLNINLGFYLTRSPPAQRATSHVSRRTRALPAQVTVQAGCTARRVGAVVLCRLLSTRSLRPPAFASFAEEGAGCGHAGAARQPGRLPAAAQAPHRARAALRGRAAHEPGGRAHGGRAHGPRHDVRRAHDGAVPHAVRVRVPAPGRAAGGRAAAGGRRRRRADRVPRRAWPRGPGPTLLWGCQACPDDVSPVAGAPRACSRSFRPGRRARASPSGCGQCELGCGRRCL